MPRCPGTPTESYALFASAWTDCFGTLTFDSGEKYVGEWKDGKKHGKGTYIYTNGEKEEELEAVSSSYVGEFKDGKRHGHGTYRHTSGSKYVGEYKDGKKHGQGTVTFTNGNNFVGAFKNGKVKWSQKMGNN